MSDYLRVRISGVLKNTSMLHIGDGTHDDFSERTGKNDDEGHYSRVCRNANGVPYLPGSALRGFLRAQCKDETLRDKLFGGQEQPGLLHIYDAAKNGHDKSHKDLPYTSVKEPKLLTTARYGIALNPVTQTVKPHHLFMHELVPPGTRFSLNIECYHNISKNDLAHILGLLSVWDGSMQSVTGKGKSKGQGRLQWTLIKTECVTEKQLKNWLGMAKDGAVKKGKTFKKNKPKPAKDAELYTVLPKDQEPKPISLHTANSSVFTAGHFQLQFYDPVLCNDPFYAPEKTSKERQKGIHVPDLSYARQANGQPIIPAATLKGALRGQARKIVATLLHLNHGKAVEEAGRYADQVIDQLFGSTRQQSSIRVSDSVAHTKHSKHHQTFNAVDRFTGGVSDSALYSIEAISCDCFEGEFSWQNPTTETLWHKGLLLLLLRDLFEGDIAVGWGKSKGFGQCYLAQLKYNNKTLNSWDALLKQTPQASEYIDHLVKKLANIEEVSHA
jgi:CRISPR/Cas system CSM-associated protein Csm3 (group 7 of RAMP superfamily)